MGEHNNWWWEAKSIPQYPDAARSQLLSSQMQSYMAAAMQYGQAALYPFLAQLSGKPLTNMLPTPPPDDGQLHISIRKKKIKFNFNN